MAEPDKQKSFPSSILRDDKGNIVNSNYTKGLADAINPKSADFEFSGPTYPIGVYIIPLTTGTIKVQLLDQTGTDYYTYSAEEVDAYKGRPFEGRVKKILKTGTTVTSLKVVW
jgi:hypothetical protein